MPAITRSSKSVRDRPRFLDQTPAETPVPQKKVEKITRLKRKIMNDEEHETMNKKQRQSRDDEPKEVNKKDRRRERKPANRRRKQPSKSTTKDPAEITSQVLSGNPGIMTPTVEDMKQLTNLRAVVELPMLNQDILNSRSTARLKSKRISNPEPSPQEDQGEDEADVEQEDHVEDNNEEPEEVENVDCPEEKTVSETSERTSEHLNSTLESVTTDKTEESVSRSTYEKLLADMKQLRDDFVASQKHTEDHIKANDRFVDGLKALLLEERNNSKQKQKEMEDQLAQITKEKEAVENQLTAQQEKEKALMDERDQLKEQVTSLESTSKERTENVKEEKDPEKPNPLLGLFDLLTGLKISSHFTDECGIDHFTCSVSSKSKQKGLEFSLSYDHEYDEVHYQPKGNFDDDQKLPSKKVPDYLKREIFFQSDQAPLFFLKLSSLIHKTNP